MISTFFEAYKNILCEKGTSTGNTGTVEITMVSSFQKYIHFLHTFLLFNILSLLKQFSICINFKLVKHNQYKSYFPNVSFFWGRFFWGRIMSN